MLIDWENVTNYLENVGSVDKVFSFPKAQSAVQITNRGSANLIYTIGSQSGTLTPTQSVKVTETISSFTLRSSAGSQLFECWGAEAGTEQDEPETDLASLASSLAERADKTSVGVSMIDYPRQGSETDDLPRFQRAVNDLAVAGGGKLIIPQDNYFVNATNPTITTPTRVLITTNHIHIIGIGNPVIKMTGISKAYIDSINDNNSSGRDVFTCFSFVGVKDCSVEGVEFSGEWDGTGVFRFQSPRAKAIGFIGVTGQCYVKNVKGSYLLGNVVNATPADATYDGFYQPCTGVHVQNSNADHCLENGFDFMGNTFDCTIDEIKSEYNGSCGFEAAGTNLKISNLTVRHNKTAGISLSATNVYASQVFSESNGSGDGTTSGHGFMVTAGSDIHLLSGTIKNNDGNGLQVYPGVSGLYIESGMVFKDNNTYSTFKAEIYMVATTSSHISNCKIRGVKIEDLNSLADYGLNLSYCDNVEISELDINLTKTGALGVLAQGTCTGLYIRDNKTNKSVSLSSSAIGSYQFNNFVTPKRFEASAVPTTGTFNTGDILIISGASNGKPCEYQCVAGGTPGTWKMTKQNGVTIGTTAARPSGLTTTDVGVRYLDTTLAASGKHITWNGSSWVDMTGTSV